MQLLSATLLLSLVTVTLSQALAPGNYAPERVACPAGVSVRPAANLSASEASWRSQRLENVIVSLDAYLANVKVPGLNVSHYIASINTSNAPVIGLAISGGGSQSGLGGLGIWQALDARYPPALKAGTGGLSQLLTYITGLSGGGETTVSCLASNNFSTIEDITKAVNFSTNYNVGVTGNATEYFTLLFTNMAEKARAGFPVSVADILGQFFRQYLNPAWGYKNYSEIAGPNTSFSRGAGPMPILTFAEVLPDSPSIGGILYPGNNATNGINLTSYEANPFEFGSWLGGRVQGFAPTEYLGTTMVKGVPRNSQTCVKGFDKFTFLQGTTANAFNFWFIDDFYNIPLFAKRDDGGLGKRQSGSGTGSVVIPPAWASNELVQLVNATATRFNQTFNQSLWATYPNPFLDYSPAMANVTELLLVDGSETGETIPIRPLMVPPRQVDFIIAYDSGSDGDYNWVNGTNLLDTALVGREGSVPFPSIPSVATMIARNYSKQATFFGCWDDPTHNVPIVLYLPNAPWSAFSNFTFTTPAFSPHQFEVTLENAFHVATLGNGTVDPQWPQCVACAVVKKSLERMGQTWPSACQQCFTKHCWDGKEVPGHANITAAMVDPSLRLNPGLSFATWNATVWNT